MPLYLSQHASADGVKRVEMFDTQVLSMTDLDALHKMKEEIKDSVTASGLNWQSRMEIYRKVQLIMGRIESLQNQSLPS